MTTFSTFDFDILCGSIPHALILDVSVSTDEEFSFILKCEKKFFEYIWLNFVLLQIFYMIEKIFFKILKEMIWGQISQVLLPIRFYIFQKRNLVK